MTDESAGDRPIDQGGDGRRAVDPVEAATDADADLQGVATWEERSAFDRLVVAAHRGLRASRRWGLVVLGVAVLLLDFAATGFLVVKEPLVGVFAALSAVPALGLVSYIWWLDRDLREPLDTLAVTFVLAFLLAGVAAAVNSVAAIPLDTLPKVALVGYFFLVVAPVEEAVKLAAVRTYAFHKPTFDTVVDGAVYGAVAGLGFATVENLSYVTQGYLMGAPGTAEPIVLAVATAAQRSFVGPGHVIYSAFAGYYLGLAKFNPDDAGPLVLKGLLVAVLIHAAYNSIVSFASFTFLAFLAFVVVYDGVFAVALVGKVRRYGSLYREAVVES